MGKTEIVEKYHGMNLTPSSDLRRSVEGTERCKMLFDQLKIIDWLESINEEYLNKSGEIFGPDLRISTSLPVEDKPNDKDSNDFVDLNNTSWGGIVAGIKWDVVKPSLFKNQTTASLYYDEKKNNFKFFISFRHSNYEDQKQDKYFYRKFFLNPVFLKMSDVDDILLTFTGELIENGVFN